MNALRILVIANLPPYVLGGAENQVARLVEVWSGLGHGVEVAGHRIPDGRVQLGSACIRTHRIRVVQRLGRAGRAASYFLSLAGLLGRVGRHFDVIYCRGLSDGALSICALKAAGRVTLPLIACPINARGVGDAYFIRSLPGWRRLVSLINRHCEAINIIAPAIKSDLLALGIVAPQLSHIPNGIALTPPPARPAPSSPRELLWTGRLSRQKGLDILLPALARVVGTGRDFRLEIIGEGPEYTALASQSLRLGLEGRVRFAGALGRDLIRERLAAADAFLLPSRYEGMSNSALEALEVGIPALLTRCGGIDTYVDENTGWVCEPENEDSLFAGLCRLLDAPPELLLAMGRRARTLVEREFELGAIARRNAELLTAVAASRWR